MRRWLARLVSAEVRRLVVELHEARRTRQIGLRAALRWHQAALIEKARASASATQHTKENSTWQ